MPCGLASVAALRCVADGFGEASAVGEHRRQLHRELPALRLGETGDVRAIVEQSDGSLLVVKREVKVTVGGCGG